MTLKILDRIHFAVKILVNGKWYSLPPSPGRERRVEIPPISPEEVAEARSFFPLDKFFIFGHARSGTTLLARLVRLHPEVHCNWQAHFFSRPPLLKALVEDPEVAAWLGRRSNRWNHGRDLSPVVLRAAADFILERDARREGKRIVGDKSPNSLLDGEAVQLMHAVYPDARLIYIIRDGRDTVLSHRFQAFIDSPQHLSKEDLRIRAEFSQNPEPFMRGERSVFTEKGIRQAAQGWVHNVMETDRVGRELYGECYLSLRYEDLIRQPWQEMKRVWDFLGASPVVDGMSGDLDRRPLPFEDLEEAVKAGSQQNPDADWQQQKAAGIAQNLRKGKEGSWREMFTPRDREVFHEVARGLLEAWEYQVV